MRETTGHHGRVSTKVKAALAGALAVLAFGAFSASTANADQGDPFAVDFNYVGLNVGVGPLGEVSEMVLSPESEDAEGNLLGPLMIRGVYSDDAGNFNLPKDTGLQFPDLSLDIDGLKIDASIELAEASTGQFDATTGELNMNPKISLSLGTDAMENLPIPVGNGPLKCVFSPLDVDLSTNPVNWPAPGKPFADTGSLTEGAVAGAWNVKPEVVAIEGGQVCTIIGGMLDAVGGLYLANSSEPISDMPAFTGTKPLPQPCPAGTTGEPGTPPADCVPIVEETCIPPKIGTFPDCIDPPVIVDPSAEITKVAVAGPGKIKAGKKIKLTVKVSNTGGLASGPIKVALKSTNKQVKVPKTVTVDVPAGKTVSRKITVKAGKKAKGKSTITAKYGSKSGKKALKVKAAKKKKKKKKSRK